MPWVTTADGVRIAVHPVGGGPALPPLVLAHATGLCGVVMAPLAGHLAATWRGLALDERGHGASDPDPSGGYDWHGFAADVLAVVDGLGLGRPFGVGHSCGATALLMAEQARPGTFEALYCFEPILFPEPVAPGQGRAEALVAVTRRRRASFESRAAAYANFAAKAPFSGFDPEVLAAYVDHGLAPAGEGQVELRCRPEDEARIYLAAPGAGAYQALAGVACPVTVAWGAGSQAVSAEFMADVAGRLARGQPQELSGLGHFGLLEDPARVAGCVRAAFADPPP